MPSSVSKSPYLRILAYHRVADYRTESFPFYQGILTATTQQFYEHMKYARNRFDVVSFRDLGFLDNSNKRWPAGLLIVTFDDGYEDNYSNAFPILKDLGLSATIFVVTSHIGASKLFFCDLVAFAIKNTRKSVAMLPEISSAPIEIKTFSQRLALIRQIFEWTKRVSEQEKNSFSSALNTRLEVELPDDLTGAMSLTWNEIREMTKTGIEFGSHSVTHADLEKLSRTNRLWEIRRSKEIIERQTGKPVIAFSYPFGEKWRISKRTRQDVAACGYRFAVSYQNGLASNGSDPYLLQRIHVRGHASIRNFRKLLR